MFIITLVTLSLFQVRDQEWHPVNLFPTSGYVERIRSGAGMSYVRKADKATFSVAMYESPLEFSETRFERAALGELPGVPPSGFELGTLMTYDIKPGFIRMHFKCYFENGWIHVWGERMPRTNRAAFRETDFTADQSFIELVARTSLSQFAGRRLSKRSPVTIGGKSLTAWTASKSGKTYVDFREAGQKLGFAINENTSAGRATFTHGGASKLVLLGSVQYKRGSDWREMGDVTMLKDGKWLVPTTVFD